jgi:hypothetical protein
VGVAVSVAVGAATEVGGAVDSGGGGAVSFFLQPVTAAVRAMQAKSSTTVVEMRCRYFNGLLLPEKSLPGNQALSNHAFRVRLRPFRAAVQDPSFKPHSTSAGFETFRSGPIPPENSGKEFRLRPLEYGGSATGPQICFNPPHSDSGVVKIIEHPSSQSGSISSACVPCLPMRHLLPAPVRHGVVAGSRELVLLRAVRQHGPDLRVAVDGALKDDVPSVRRPRRVVVVA